MLVRLTGVAVALARLLSRAADRLLAPDDGIAPTGSGSVRGPIASMPESSAQAQG